MRVKIRELICKQCGYKWIPRTSDVRMCPKCKSVNWDRFKEKEATNGQGSI